MAEMGLTNLSFRNNAAEGLPEGPAFDLVITQDGLHDMARADLVAAQVCKVSELLN